MTELKKRIRVKTDVPERKTSEILSEILEIVKASYIVDTSTNLSSNDFSRIKNRQNTPSLGKLKNIQACLSVTIENLNTLEKEFNKNINTLERTLS